MPLLVALAVEQDHIIPDIRFHNGTDLCVPGAGIKGDGQDQLVPGGEIGGKIKSV